MILTIKGKEQLNEISKGNDVKRLACMMGLLEGFKLEKKMIGMMNAIDSSLKRGVYDINDKRVVIHNCKGEYEGVSSKYKEKLEGLRKQIREYILKAMELGMGDFEIIQESYKGYFE
jgi:hypothetical protein